MNYGCDLKDRSYTYAVDKAMWKYNHTRHSVLHTDAFDLYDFVCDAVQYLWYKVVTWMFDVDKNDTYGTRKAGWETDEVDCWVLVNIYWRDIRVYELMMTTTTMSVVVIMIKMTMMVALAAAVVVMIMIVMEMRPMLLMVTTMMTMIVFVIIGWWWWWQWWRWWLQWRRQQRCWLRWWC